MMLHASKEEIEINKKMQEPGITNEEWLAYEEQLKVIWEKEREELKDCPFAH